MASSKIAALNNVFQSRGAVAATQEPTAATETQPGNRTASRVPSREGKLHISAWLSPGYKVSLRAIQMKHPQRHLQDLFSEALNDLFAKYNVPTTRE